MCHSSHEDDDVPSDNILTCGIALIFIQFIPATISDMMSVSSINKYHNATFYYECPQIFDILVVSCFINAGVPFISFMLLMFLSHKFYSWCCIALLQFSQFVTLLLALLVQYDVNESCQTYTSEMGILIYSGAHYLFAGLVIIYYVASFLEFIGIFYAGACVKRSKRTTIDNNNSNRNEANRDNSAHDDYTTIIGN